MQVFAEGKPRTKSSILQSNEATSTHETRECKLHENTTAELVTITLDR